VKLDLEPTSGIKKRKLKRATRRGFLPRSKAARIAALERDMAMLHDLLDQNPSDLEWLTAHIRDLEAELERTLLLVRRLVGIMKAATKEDE
jgi:hypothetical protein